MIDASRRDRHHLLQRLVHAPFRRREPLRVRVRRVGQQDEASRVPDLAELLHLGQLAVDRVLVELVVGRMDDGAERRVDDDAHGIRDAVTDVEELDPERAQLDRAVRVDGIQLTVGQQPRFFQLDLRQPARQCRRVHRHVQVLQQVGQRADVVFMPVGQHDRQDPVCPFRQVLDVRIHEIDARHVALGEHEARIDHEDVTIVLQRQQILPDLTETAQRDHPQRCVTHKRDLPDTGKDKSVIACSPRSRPTIAGFS